VALALFFFISFPFPNSLLFLFTKTLYKNSPLSHVIPWNYLVSWNVPLISTFVSTPYPPSPKKNFS
jgi:hypothetical protein